MRSTIFDLLMSLAQARGTQFVSVRGYANSQGEVSNYVLNLGSKYETARAKDIAKLKKRLAEKDYRRPIELQAITEVLQGLENPNVNRSKGQTNAYETIAGFPMLRRHKETKELYVYGQKISKKVLVKGDYKADTRNPLTIEKDKVRKGLSTSKIRLMKLGREEEMIVQGRVIDLK